MGRETVIPVQNVIDRYDQMKFKALLSLWNLSSEVRSYTNTKKWRRGEEVKLIFLFEWDNPKNEERLEKLLKHRWENVEPYIQKLIKDKEVKVESKYWQDINGRYH